MTEVSTLGFDLAKRVFQVHGVDGEGAVTIRRQLRRSEVVTVTRPHMEFVPVKTEKARHNPASIFPGQGH